MVFTIDLIINSFVQIFGKHVPLKKKFLRGNQTPFMLKEFQKVNPDRSSLRSKFDSTPQNKIKIYSRNKKIGFSIWAKVLQATLRKM